MVKKLLILVLVLGLASTAGAVGTDILSDIQLVLDGTTVNVVGLDATADASWSDGGIYVASGEPGIVSGPLHTYAAAGGLRAIQQWTGYNGVDIRIGAGQDEMTTGLWFDFQYTGGSVGDMFDIWDYSASTTAAVGQLPLVPEPMTLALLGLGGLFLRRRK